MGCACNKRNGKRQFLWYDPAKAEDVKPVVYNSEIEAKAKVLRKQGTYTPYNPNEPIGVQIQIAESARAAAQG